MHVEYNQTHLNEMHLTDTHQTEIHRQNTRDIISPLVLAQ
jgi:hypothetical protein